MKIYSIALFLIFVNLSVAFFVAADILPVEISAKPMSVDSFQSMASTNLSYSNADIAMYVFGDFPRAIGTLMKLLIYAPSTLTWLLAEVGMPEAITNLFMIGTWIVYAVGLLQFLGKWSMEGNS